MTIKLYFSKITIRVLNYGCSYTKWFEIMSYVICHMPRAYE